MLRFGPDTGPVVVMLPALFEEHNRTRAFTVAICRALAGSQVASILPDLPGQGESVVPTQDATLDHWRKAVAALVQAQPAIRPVIMGSMRGSAIVDDVSGISGHWRLSPITGQMVIRDLTRGAVMQPSPTAAPIGDPVEAAGNLISHNLFGALQADVTLREVTAPLRTVRLESDPAPADLKLPGSPLWRRAEPGNDLPLAALLAQDLAAWSHQCAG